MKVDGIDFNEQWLIGVTEKQFIDQHINAFDETDHPIAKMNATDKKKFLKHAYFLCRGTKAGGVELPAPLNYGDTEPIDKEV